MSSPTASSTPPARAGALIGEGPALGAPGPDTPPAIRCEGVSVRYRVPRERIRTLKEYAIRRLRGRIEEHEFWALRDVDLEVRGGEIFGIVGRNGAGKSTLLKVVARVLHPTRGRVRVRGRVAPLLELGGGFHPELTGRENVFLNGTLLGRTHREIEERYPEILQFSELTEFIHAPLRTYSSGMVARLGFAVATAWEPEVLIVDEVLSVGDEAFQRKCVERMEGFCARGMTILLVSHSADLVRAMCGYAAWLDHGLVQAVGPAANVVAAYQQAPES